jgi:hypothetical protein
MRKLLFITFLLLSISFLGAEIIKTEIHFDEPIIKTEGSETLITFTNCHNLGKLGEPTLPYFGLKLLLPPSNVAQDIKLIKKDFVQLPDTYSLLVYQPQYPLSDATYHQPLPAKPEVYSSKQVYPSKSVINLKSHKWAGYNLATAAITPIEYIPANGKVGYYSKIEVILETKMQNSEFDINVNNTAPDIVNFVTSNVENPQKINSYNMSREREEIDLLIIAAEEKLEVWEEYAEIYNTMGYTVNIHSVEDIEAEINGTDLAEKIRRYIKNVYMENNLTNVLLAGDTDVIPERGFYVDNGSEADDNIPADMYYACLDGNWNADNDGYWGEATEADLAPELAIGRFCYNNDSEIENFINKINNYWHSPIPNEVTTSLFVGELLWRDLTYGGDYMDELIGSSATNGHVTTGVPTDWQISKLYERDENWGTSQILSELSKGPNLVNHLGHSSANYNMKLSTSQVTDNNITNSGDNHGYSIHFSQGCYAGSFDNRKSTGYFGPDCITEKFTSISNSAVSMIAHSRYGWGMQGSTNGASQFLHREFIDAIFGENIVELGFALMDVKLDVIPFLDSPTLYWVNYETNLIGDPLLKVRTQTPENISVIHAEQIVVGTTELEIDADINAANIVLTQNENIIAIGYTGLYGQTTLQFEPIQNLEPLQLQISKYNYQTYTAEIAVLNSTSPYVVAPEVEFIENGAYNDGYLQSNDILNMNVTFQNMGNSNTIGQPVANLSCSSNFITILEGETTLQSIEANGTLTLEDAFQIKVEPGIIENTEIELLVEISYEGEVWESTLNLPLVTPQIEYVEPLLSLISGADDQLNPGESAELYLIYQNTGAGVSYDLATTVFCYDSYITVSGSDLIPSIDPGTEVTTWQPIQISIAENCPVDYEFNLDLMAYDNIGASVFETIALEVVYNVANDQNLPAVTKLNKNYPNPFNPQTSISYSLKQAGPVKIEIFNIKGQLVRTLVNTTKKAGKYNAVWFGQNDSGSKVGSGIYFYKMQTTDFTDIERMLLLK